MSSKQMKPSLQSLEVSQRWKQKLWAPVLTQASSSDSQDSVHSALQMPVLFCLFGDSVRQTPLEHWSG